MIVRFTGGPLDGLQREIEQRDIHPTMTVQSYAPDNPGHTLTGYWPEEDARMVAGETACYRGRQWWAGSGDGARFLCVEYVYQGR